jgi:hypothetical protein
VNSIGAGDHFHPDFGANWDGGPFGIPYVTVPGSQPRVPISFDYDDESDPGPYPIPANAPIEGGAGSSGDRHVLVVNSGECKLYEVFAAYPQNGGASWTAGSGAVWSLNSNALRPDTWTSADAAGLPMLPLLVRYPCSSTACSWPTTAPTGSCRACPMPAGTTTTCTACRRPSPATTSRPWTSPH